MPDYNLGRAHAEVKITADVDDATRGLGEYERATRGATAAAQEQSRIERELTDRRRAATDAAQRRKDAEAEYKRVMADSNATAEDQVRVEAERNRARGEHLQATRRAAEAEKAYRAEIAGNTDAVERFIHKLDDLGGAHDRAGRHVNDFRKELQGAQRDAKELAGILSGVLGAAVKGLAVTGGIGIAGGAAGLLGAGGIQGLVSVLGAATELIKDFSGVVALLPAGVAGAAAVLGTLATAFHGVGEGLQAAWAGDPAKFAEAIRNLAPAAAQVVTIFASFTNAIKGAMQAVQQELFAPLVDQIQPLITTWLPALMNAGKQIAAIFGQAGRMLAQWLQQPQTMAAFQSFINSLTTALQRMLPAIEPIANAFSTLTTVGAQFFPQIADTIVKMANSFNAMVQDASATGGLQAWIQTALTSFSQLWDVIKNLASAFSNINQLAGGPGQGFLGWLIKVTAEFKAWTQSVEGAQAISAFFTVLNQASTTLSPILKTIGTTLLVLITNMIQLGINIGPGLLSFFQGLQQALAQLGQALVGSGPAFNQALKTLGDVLVKIVQEVGPQLPNLFQTFADAMTQLAPAIVTVAQGAAELMAHLTPNELLIIGGIIGALQGFVAVAGIITTVTAAVEGLTAAFAFLAANPIVLLIGAIAALVAGIIYLYNTNETFHNAINGLWEDLKSFAQWIASNFVGGVRKIGDAFSDTWDAINNSFGTFLDQAYDWGRNIVQRVIDGFRDMFKPLTDTWSWLMGGVRDQTPSSPPKKGPLSGEGDPLVTGRKTAERFAQGMTEGASSVSDAAGNVVGGASSMGASGFTSAGVSGRSGGSFSSDRGKSGFDSWVGSITQDLQAWLSLVRNAFGLFEKVSDIFVQTSKVVASLWNQGDNPLTQPGGIFSKDKALTPEQQMIPGVENITPHGTAPLPELTPQGNMPKGSAPVVPQVGVPGVPSAGSVGTVAPPAPPATPPAKASGPGSAGGSLIGPAGAAGGANPVAAAPGDTPLVAALKRKGFSPAQIRLVQAFSNVEGNNPAGNPTLGFTDAQLGGATDINSHVDALYKQFQDRQGATTARGTKIGAFPENGTDQEQAQWIADVVGQAGLSSDWQGNAQPGDYVSRVKAGLAGIPLPNVQGQAPPSVQGMVGPGATGPSGPTTGGLFGPALGPGGTKPPVVEQFTPTSYGLAKGTDTGGYGSGTNGVFPQWVMDLGARFGVKPSTYASHQESNRDEAGYAPNPQNLNRGIDWVGSRENMEKFAQALLAYGGAEGRGGGLEQVIYQAGPGGTKYGLGGAGNVQASYYPQSGKGSYDEHGGTDSGAHVHTRFSTSVPISLQTGPQIAPSSVSTPIPRAPATTPAPPATQTATATDTTAGDWMRVPVGADINQPIPNEVRRAHGIPDDVPPIFYSAQPGTVTNVAVPPNYSGTTPVSPRQTISVPLPGAQPGFSGTQQSSQSPIETFQSTMSGVSSIAGDAFRVFDDVIKSIGAAANLTDTMVRGFANTQDVMGAIDQVQQFITTAADVAKLVSSTTGFAGSLVGAGAGADPSGGASGAAAALQAASAIAGIVQSGLEATNMAIDLGQEAWKQLSKYGAIFAGSILGGANGMLSGDVRMLLNTATGQIQAYSEDNPDLKTDHNLPSWFARSYGGNRPELQQPRLAQVNIYAGPGQTPSAMMQESMWLVGSGAPSVASVAGQD